MEPTTQFSAHFFDLGGTLLALENDEIVVDSVGRVSLLANVEARLKDLAGQPVYVITNQSGVARGTLTEAAAIGFIAQLNQQVGGVISDYRICMHHPEVGCACRKPKPGLLLDLAEAHGIELAQAVMVGDTTTDRDCAAAARVGTFVWADVFFDRIRLEPVSDANRARISSLEVAEDQRAFINDGAPISGFIANAPLHPTFSVHGIYARTTWSA